MNWLALSLFSAMTMPRLLVDSSSERRRAMSGRKRSGEHDDGPGKRGDGVHHAVEVGALRNNAHILIHRQHFGGASPEDCLGIGKDHFIHDSRTIRRGNGDRAGTLWPA